MSVALLGAASRLSREVLPIALSRFDRVSCVLRGGANRILPFFEDRKAEACSRIEAAAAASKPQGGKAFREFELEQKEAEALLAGAERVLEAHSSGQLQCLDVDVSDASALGAALDGSQTVLSCLSPAADSRNFEELHRRLVGNAIETAAAVKSVERMVVVGGAGILTLLPFGDSRQRLGHLPEPEVHARLQRGKLVMDGRYSRWAQAIAPLYAQYQRAHLENLRLLAHHFEDHAMICPGFMLDKPGVGAPPKVFLDENDHGFGGLEGIAVIYKDVAPVCVDALEGKYKGRRVGISTEPALIQSRLRLEGIFKKVLPVLHIRN